MMFGSACSNGGDGRRNTATRQTSCSSNRAPTTRAAVRRVIACLALTLICFPVAFARVMDDFEDGVKTGWFDYVTGMGGSVTEGFGVLTVNLPVGRTRGPVFVATSRAGERMILEPGQTLELRVNLVGVSSPDVFAVLAWVPDSQPLSHFTSYFIAQSATEIRVGKALHKYFWRETPAVPLKQQNVTLALSLTAEGSQVILRALALDRDADDAVLFDRSFVDTPAADLLNRGTDDPPSPWSGAGQFALIGYFEGGLEEPGSVQVFFDDAEANTAAPTNLRPVFYDVTPTNTASFLSLDTRFVLHATDDQRWWGETTDALAGFTEGPFYAQAIGLVSGSDGKTLLANTKARLTPNANYTVRLIAVDAGHASNEFFLHFDTFCPASRVVEVEDYNFGGGRFLDSPTLIPESAGPTNTAYLWQVGEPEVDFHDTRAGPSASLYRPSDPVATKRSLDYRRPWFVAASDETTEVFDYDVHEIEAGEYLVYTRTFGPGDYEVYLREAVLNLDRSESALERVARTPEGGEIVTELGRFVAGSSGFEYRNVPLTDANGDAVKVHLDGMETLRLRQLTAVPADTAIYENYLVFASPVGECFSIESAPTVFGPYAPDWAAYVAGGTVTIRPPTNGTSFYRVLAETPRRMVNVRRVGDLLMFDVE